MIINKRASFGLNLPYLEAIQLFLLIVLMVAWWKDKRAWGWLLMIIGGGLNLVERWRWGGVRDYWSIPLTSIYNNLNDYLIAFGVVQLIIYYIWKKRQK